MEHYFTSGQFAKLCSVNKKTLFHYDSIGLFKPEITDNNGYRYYSPKQLDVFNVITELKEIGMPLSDIKYFIDNRSPELVIDLFKMKIDKIKEEIENLNRIQKILETKIEINKKGLNIYEEINIEEQPEEYLVLSEKIKETSYEYDLDTFSEHCTYCLENKINIGYPVGSIMNKDSMIRRKYVYTNFFTRVEKGSDSNIIVKKAGLYLVGYIKGYYDKSFLLYDKMMNYAEENNIKIIGDGYEEALIDEISSNERNNYVLKISIPIDKL